MKKSFITKKKKKKKVKILFFLFMLIIGLIISYKSLEKSKYTIKEKDFINLIIEESFSYTSDTIINKLMDKTLEVTNPIKLMNKEYNKYIEKTTEKRVLKEETPPIIYLYNTHQTEEYKSSSFIEFSINPTVVMNDYILEDIFNKNGYKTYVEEKSIKEILRKNNWNYSSSYKASRILLEDAIINNPSLKYFIDIHRDSLKRNQTTITIEGKEYAKLLFIVGMENKNYQKNLELTEKINKKLNEQYPNLSKGIYKKSGPGVNGVYNQDFSENTILIEIGGVENTTNEVLNSSIAFAECFMEVINE